MKKTYMSDNNIKTKSQLEQALYSAAGDLRSKMDAMNIRTIYWE